MCNHKSGAQPCKTKQNSKDPGFTATATGSQTLWMQVAHRQPALLSSRHSNSAPWPFLETQNLPQQKLS